ncbi:unnamed protein product [Sphagnum tenellum]
METTLQEIEKVAIMAMHCLAFKGDDRPSMKQVTEALHQIKGCYCQWSEGRRNMSSEFGVVGVHEMKLVQELELLQLIDANTPNSSQSSNTLSISNHSNNSSSLCVKI